MTLRASPSPRAPRSTRTERVSLLTRLRRDTKEVHETLDRESLPFQSDPASHLTWFLAAQMSGLTALSSAAQVPHDPDTLTLLSEVLDRLDHDCKRLSLSVPVVRVRGQIHPDALAYLVIGSRLGTEVLRRKLDEANISEIPAYFTRQDYRHAWQNLCARLEAQPGAGKAADDVAQSALIGFRVFQDAIALAKETTGYQT